MTDAPTSRPGDGEARRDDGARDRWVRGLEPVRAPRGLDFVVAALPPLAHGDLVTVLNTAQPDLDDATPLEWLADEGSPILAILALLTPPRLVGRARHLLGAQLTSDIASDGDSRVVDAWTNGRRTPPDAALFRLAAACCAAALLRAYAPATDIPTWFLHPHPRLSGHAPSAALREGPADGAAILVLIAARKTAGLRL